MPLISVLIPTFNSEKYVSTCLSSILSQKFSDYEIIIKDGLSTDNTLRIISAIKQKNPFVPIRIYSEKDSGIYDAMNQAIRYAASEWVLFLGSDDQLYNDNVLLNVSPSLEHSTADLVYGNVLISGDSLWALNGKIYDGEFSRESLVVRNICHQSIFYRRSVFNKIGYFNTQYNVAADWDFNHRCFAHSEPQYIDLVIAIFNAGGLSTHINRDKFIEEDMVINLAKYYGISYFNRLLNGFSDQFLFHANKKLQRNNIAGFFYFYFVALWHAQNKITFIKYSLLQLKKQMSK